MNLEYAMNINEKLFKLSDIYNQDIIEFDNTIGEILFGKLILNKVESIAYINLCKNSKLNLGRFKKSFNVLHEKNLQDTDFYKRAISFVSKMFCNANFEYAFLKGAFLIPSIYEKGLRQSGDIDILIEERNIDKCQKILVDNGFVQGNLKNGEIQAATRTEIIMSRMNYGETIPFYKKTQDNYIVIDINFSLDYKPAEDNMIIREMLKKTIDVPLNDTFLKTLCLSDFIIHLCMHLYKEAATYDWVLRRSDLNLYKFSDINVIFHEKVTKAIYGEIIEKIHEYGVEKECYYALFYTAEIYNNLTDILEYSILLEKIKPDNLDYLHQIIDPMQKKIYTYDMSFKEWFACENRVSYLKEV